MSSARVLYSAPTLPIDVHGKAPPAHPSPPHYGRMSVSPPEEVTGATSSGLSSTVPSLTNSSAGSTAGDYDSSSSGGGSGIDLMDLLNDRLTNSFDPLPLDRSLATQAQT